MTENHVHTAEFDAKIGRGGTLHIPDDVVSALGLVEGGKLSVRIVGGSAMTSLRRSGVTNEEIDRIAAMQLEPAGQVVKFLLSEGALRERGKKGVGRRGLGGAR